MTHSNAGFSEPLPREVRTCLEGLGQRVKTARVRRGLSTEDFAQECGIGRRSLYRIETGEPGVALGTFLSVLWKLGLLESVQGVAHPDDDEHGKILEAARRPERVRSHVAQDNDF
jgi:transcriptional regulator with XRE-family HTH domain